MDVSYRTPKTALTRTGGFLMGYTHSLNPYGGCAFGRETAHGRGCPFCYVRESPVARFGPGPWGTWALVKKGIDGRLSAELKKLDRSQVRVFMSSATDPYQGLEARHELTRACLKVFRRLPVAALAVQTRSVLVERDFDLLAEMTAFTWLNLTLETNREDVRRALTPTSPTVEKRLAVARAARARGIPVQIVVSPLLPCDAETFAEQLAGAADRVVVDTLLAGDGASGARSRRLGMGEQLAALGFPEYFQPDAEQVLISALRSRMGAAQVLFSQEGFSDFGLAGASPAAEGGSDRAELSRNELDLSMIDV